MEHHAIEIGRETIAFRLKRSSRKTLGISVDPEGAVLVAAPATATFEAITAVVQRRAAWILDKQYDARNRPVPTLPRRYLPGETHLFLGRQYRLSVDPDTPGTRRQGDRIVVGGVTADEPGRVRNRLRNWYSREARQIFSDRLDACLNYFKGEFERRPKLKIRPLDKRWGSYVATSNTLILNRDLIQAALPQIDYVIVHELCHVNHQDHGREFLAALSAKLPDWSARKEKLELLAT